MKLVLEFPAFLFSMLLGGNVHDFDPFPIYVIYGMVLIAIVYSAASVQARQKGTTTAT